MSKGCGEGGDEKTKGGARRKRGRGEVNDALSLSDRRLRGIARAFTIERSSPPQTSKPDFLHMMGNNKLSSEGEGGGDGEMCCQNPEFVSV